MAKAVGISRGRMLRDLLSREGITRMVLARRVSITMETTFCIEAVEEALARYFYNQRRPRSALDRQTSDEAFFPVVAWPRVA